MGGGSLSRGVSLTETPLDRDLPGQTPWTETSLNRDTPRQRHLLDRDTPRQRHPLDRDPCRDPPWSETLL